MTSLQTLQKRLRELPEGEQETVAAALLRAWEEMQWDQQIEADIEAGKLDYLIDEVEQDIAAGKARPL